jgi:hypothetical protein
LRTSGILAVAIVLSMSGLRPGASAAQDDVDILVRSSTSGGGSLVAQFDFASKVPVFQSVCIGGQCLFSATDPGFRTPGDTGAGAFPLSPGTSIGLEIVALHAGASVKIGNAVLSAPGQSATLGTALSLHVHPSWQVTVPQGTTGDFPVTFRLTSTAAAYAASQPYTLILTNGAVVTPTATITLTPAPPSATPSRAPTETPAVPPTGTAAPTLTSTRRATPTASPTHSPTPSPTPREGPLPADVNCDGRVSAPDLVARVVIAAEPPPVPPCDLRETPSLGFVVEAIFDPEEQG